MIHPPADLPNEATALFEAVVAQNPHLREADLPLLVAFCRTAPMIRLLEDQMLGDSGLEPEGWQDLMVSSIHDLKRTLAVLAMDLRLNPPKNQHTDRLEVLASRVQGSRTHQ